ncbi:MAG TPA: quinone-dependent dihydroorotate dehydrogenase [Cyclobacteriaceae bacterium]
MYALIKNLLFSLPPERAHYLTLNLFSVLIDLPIIGPGIKSLFRYEDRSLEKDLCGLHFINPVGLAAGFDKNAKYLKVFDALGFGFVEIGTVTPKAQPGNQKPRLFRLPKDEALINRLGFNNEGVESVIENLKKYKGKAIVGGNIGKNKVTPNEKAVDDYIYCFEKLYDHVDYFTVNVSSPNTPGLRSLQEKKPLKEILNTLMGIKRMKENNKPVFLKIAPDLSENQLDDILAIVTETQIDGVIATNTTIGREKLNTDNKTIDRFANGGLSGKPLKKKSDEVINYLVKNSKFPVIGVGGIYDSQVAKEKMNLGCDLIQLYTGLIYQGPFFIKAIKKQLVN